MQDSTAPVFEVFYDGGCPLCKREIGMIRRLDRRGRLRFTDIDAPDFRAETVGKSHDELMARIYGRLADGTWVTGVEVFRQLYGAVGLRPLAWLSRAPGISHGLDLAYRIFARHRLKLTGRCTTDRCGIPQAPR
jgi:predicted DCC family thiol-disulfide oxidoreductase YuxK